jgi:alcohol dehydrogenase class IV
MRGSHAGAGRTQTGLLGLAEAAWRPAGTWSGSSAGMRLMFGAGAIDKLGEICRETGGRRALLVTDPGVRAAGHARRAEAALAAASIESTLFDGVEENPTTSHVEAGASFARGMSIDLIVGLGGGSAMDCAKGINFLLTNGGKMEDYWGAGRASKPMLPSIGVPTTAGTGSEAQSYALIEQEGSRLKMACGDEKARFRGVVLDPDVTASLPPSVAATAGMDAVSHAVESYVSTRASEASRDLARAAWSLLSSAFENVLRDRDAAAARGRMLAGAHLAGAAIEASMLGAAHACANPLTSRFGVPHGAAVLLMLPHVMRFNDPVAGPWYADLLRAGDPGRPASASLVERVTAMRNRGALPARVAEAGVPREALPSLAHEASQQWTARFNPRPVAETDLLEIYESAY